jgi:hypothetical protein
MHGEHHDTERDQQVHESPGHAALEAGNDQNDAADEGHQTKDGGQNREKDVHAFLTPDDSSMVAVSAAGPGP